MGDLIFWGNVPSHNLKSWIMKMAKNCLKYLVNSPQAYVWESLPGCLHMR